MSVQQDSLPSFLSTAEMLAVQGLTVNNDETAAVKNPIYTPATTPPTGAFVQSVAPPTNATAAPPIVTINTRLSAPALNEIRPIATYTLPMQSMGGILETIAVPSSLKIRQSSIGKVVDNTID